MENNYQLRKRSYSIYNEFLFKELNKTADSFIMGMEQNDTLPLWNMFFFLLQMRYEDYASARPTQEEIDCMIDKLYCSNIDAYQLTELWPASYPSKGDDSFPRDGIGYMQLKPNIDNPVFRIR
jgi:hypothetical protein